MIKGLVRTFSFFGRWLAELLRQPVLVLVLVVGPFLVLLAFGLGVTAFEPRPKTIVVVPAQGGARDVPQRLGEHLDIVGQTSDLDQAREQLRRGDADAVVVLPGDPRQAIASGQHARLTVVTNEIDPIRRAFIQSYLNDQVASLNQQAVRGLVESAQASSGEIDRQIEQARGYIALIRSSRGDAQAARRQLQELRAVTDALAQAASQVASAQREASLFAPGLEDLSRRADRVSRGASELDQDVSNLESRLGAAGDPPGTLEQDLARVEADLDELDRAVAEAAAVPAEVLSAPFQLDLENAAPFAPTYVAFYAPAVLALLLQHLAITLGALSLARVRLLGVMELLRVSPARSSEVVVGNYLSYGVLCAIVAAALTALLVLWLDVPLIGTYLDFAAVLVLLVLSALGIGFLVATLSSTEHQAAQFAMLVLLAAIFFSGFIVGLERVTWPVRAISYLLPSTYAIRSLQDVMLRGVLRAPTDLVVLLAAGVLLFAATVYLFRREFRPG